MLLTEAIDNFLATMRIEGYSPNTVKLYRAALQHVSTYALAHGCTQLDQLTPDVVRGTQGAALEKPKNPPPNWKGGQCVANQILAAARTMSHRYQHDGYAVPDLSGVRHVKEPQRIQPRLTGPEFQLLERALGSRLLRKITPRFLVARDQAILQVLVETGLRAAEMCALDLDDIDFQEGSVLVRHGKGGKDRALSIVDPDPSETDGGTALRALADYLGHREKLPGALLKSALWLTPTKATD